MIPKKIHYCWFGHNPLPPLANKCIESWKKFLPDYEIIEWNESNYDVNKISYIKEAYEAKKYAFVSDYARFDILYQEGGIYFDTDVEVIKDLSPILSKGPFMGLEESGLVNVGLGFAAIKEDSFLKEVMNTYTNDSFIKNGSYNEYTVVERVSDLLKEKGLGLEDKEYSIGGYNIYPIEYFCPKNANTGIVTLTNNSYSIHHYDGSWISDNMKKLYSEKQWLAQNVSLTFVRIILEKLCVLKKVIKDLIIK